MTQNATVTTPPSIEMLTLSSLVSLKDSGIKVPEAAMRDLDVKHVEHLTLSNYEEWPPVVVFDHPSGYVMADGYHREDARKNQAALSHLQSSGEYDILDKKPGQIEQALARVKASENIMSTLLDNTLIKAEIRPFTGDREIIKAALLANTKHGKGLKSPVNQALEYYRITRDEEQAPNQSQVADMFYISRQALSKYIEKHNIFPKEAAKSLDTASDMASEEKESEPKEELSPEEKKRNRAVKTLIEAIEQNPETTRPLILKLFPVLVKGLSQSFAFNEDKEYTEALSGIVQGDSRFDIERLVLRLGEALNPELGSIQKKGKAKGKGKGKANQDGTLEPLPQEEIPSEGQEAQTT